LTLEDLDTLRQHFARVNDAAPQALDAYYGQKWAAWRELSQFVWLVDFAEWAPAVTGKRRFHLAEPHEKVRGTALDPIDPVVTRFNEQQRGYFKQLNDPAALNPSMPYNPGPAITGLAAHPPSGSTASSPLVTGASDDESIAPNKIEQQPEAH
jgi:hypothetical protein